MSLLFTIILKEAIVMASDSRTTYHNKDDSVRYVDTTYKTVLMDDKIGISHCRNASFNGRSITDHLQDFMRIYKGRCITRIPNLLKTYFNNLSPNLDVIFFVSGYYNNEPKFYRVYTKGDIETCKKPNIGQQFWDGERVVPSKLFGRVYYFDNGKYISHPDYKNKFASFDIHDSVKFINYLYTTAEGYMSFFNCDQTIGGYIDILIIRPDFSYWYQKKNV